tara:strand:- start:10 stop:312 length:303 start_codon:yes stop_codon:yes gene_type:complete
MDNTRIMFKKWCSVCANSIFNKPGIQFEQLLSILVASLPVARDPNPKQVPLSIISAGVVRGFWKPIRDSSHEAQFFLTEKGLKLVTEYKDLPKSGSTGNL